MRRTVCAAVSGLSVVVLAACGVPAAPAPAAPSAGAPAGGSGLFAGAQPWTVDVSGAPASDRSPVVLAALTAAGGWGNGNVFQVDFAMPVLTADPATPRTAVVGAENYCDGGPDCDPVPAEIPVPDGAHLEGSDDLTCDAANEDCHLLVADPGQRRLYEIYQGTGDARQITAKGFFVWDLDRTYDDRLRGPQCTSADAAGFPIDAQSFARLTVDDFAVVDHGPEVPLTYACERN